MMNLNGFPDRLRAAMRRADLKVDGLAAASGVSASGIKKWLSAAAEPRLGNITDIAKALGVTPDWLVFGSESLTANAEPVPPRNMPVSIPFYDVRASAGPGETPVEEKPSRQIDIGSALLERLGIAANDVIAMEATGDSGEPNISAGDLLLVDRSQNHPQDGGMYIIGVDGDVLVKRIQRLIDGGLLLKSDNPAYEAQKVSSAEAQVVGLRIIGRVKYALRSV